MSDQLEPNRQSVTSQTIFSYVKKLDASILDELYNHHLTCLVIFKELPELAKHFILRLIFVEQPIPKSIVSSWVDINASKMLKTAVESLTELRIWYSQDTNSSRGSYRLNKKFQESLRACLFGGSKSSLSHLGSIVQDKNYKDKVFLTSYANERWNSLLHFMVGSKLGEVGTCVKEVLIQSQLMKADPSDPTLGITEKGFKFLLATRSQQILEFVLNYFDYIEKKQMVLTEALQFIFQLNFLTVDKCYPIDVLTPTQLEVLQHMRELGLAYQRKRVAPRFYITPLALCLTDEIMDNATLESFNNVNNGYIVVETNFRIYSYTNCPLQTALISLFSSIRTRFPNLVVADITRDAVRGALMRGITADQIVSFLRSNLHPDIKMKPTPLPPTVVDQIRLWEIERNRFTFIEGCLYEQFTKATDFEMVRDYAKSIDVLLWENPEKRLMVVSKIGHEDVRKFWKTKKN